MNFIIFGTGRTGSKILNTYLHQQKEIYSFGEIFNKNKDLYIEKQFDTVRDNLIHEINKNHGQIDLNAFKIKHPEILLNLFAKYSTKQICGFKLFFSHLQKTHNASNLNLIDFAINNKTKFIILNRRNIFLNYLSTRKAFISRVYNMSINFPERNDDIKIYINPNDYKTWKNNISNSYSKWEELFINHNIPFTKICYEDIIGPNKKQEKERIYKFIAGDNVIPIEKHMVYLQQNIYTLKHQIENYEEVCKALKDDPDFTDALEQDIGKIGL